MRRTPTLMSTVRFGRALFATNLKAAFALRAAFTMQVIFMALNNVVFFTFWWVLQRRVPNIRGWTLGDIEVLFGVTATGYGLVAGLAGGVRFLGRAIEDGELDTLLTQPQPTLLYASGMRSQASGFGDVLSGVGFLVASGHLEWSNAPIVGIAVLAAATTFFAAGVLFFSLAFWVARTEALSRHLWELLITFALYPEPLFGSGLRLVLYTLLPAGLVAYLPVHVIQHPSIVGVTWLLASVCAYVAIAIWAFHAGLKRYTSGSRFVSMG